MRSLTCQILGDGEVADVFEADEGGNAGSTEGLPSAKVLLQCDPFTIPLAQERLRGGEKGRTRRKRGTTLTATPAPS